MAIVKSYLALVGALYVGLSIWCTVDPASTSDRVGFTRNGGSGNSEFLVIYGGLEMAMAILFLLPLFDATYLRFSLAACIIIHACLVAYRTASYLIYSDISGLTHRLALGEWIILLTSVGCAWLLRRQGSL